MDERSTGSCLCGGVNYSVTGPVRDVWQCHCRRCQKFTGNFMAGSAATWDAISFESDATLMWYSPDDDPDVTYGFCNHCGSSIFWRVAAQPGHVSICAGTFDDVRPLETVTIWFSDHAAPHTPLDDSIEQIPSTDL